MNQLDSFLVADELEQIKRWCLFRQKSGFQGRPNKPVDTCYSFWVGASLEVFKWKVSCKNRKIDTLLLSILYFGKFPGNVHLHCEYVNQVKQCHSGLTSMPNCRGIPRFSHKTNKKLLLSILPSSLR